jgi:hypothetical protein
MQFEQQPNAAQWSTPDGAHYGSGDSGKLAVLFKLDPAKPAAEVAWDSTPTSGVFCGNSTPHIDGETIFGSDCEVGNLRAVSLKDGKRLWETFAPTTGGDRRASHGTAFLTRHGERYFLFSETGDPDEARKAYEQALKILERLVRDNPTVTGYAHDLGTTYHSLGFLFSDSGHPDEARKALEQALKIREPLVRDHTEMPDYASDLGGTLNNLAQLDLRSQRFAEARDRLREAIAWQKKALATNAKNPTYRQFLRNHYVNLSQAAVGLGDAALIAEAQQAIAELDASDPALQALDRRLEAVLQGEAPKDNPERLVLAQRAYATRQFALAARLWAEAIAAQPELAEDRQAQQRYNAACAAALASSGAGQSPAELDENAKLKLRDEAYDSLLAELETWSKEMATTEQRAAVARALEYWKQDSDLLSVRDKAALEMLPEDERAKWVMLWTRVDELLAKATNERPS